MSDNEGLFKFLAALQAEQHALKVEIKEKHHSLECRNEVLQVLNEKTEYLVRKKDEEIAKLRQTIGQMQRNETRITSERDVARKELDIISSTHDLTKRERDGLEMKLRDSEEKRRKLRSSYNELGRLLPCEVQEDENVSEVMKNVRGLLMN